MHENYLKLAQRGRDFLGVDYPIMCGAMTWISDADLVAAVAGAGGFGLLAAGNMPPEMLSEEIDKTRALTDKPFGVNLITVAPNYRAHLDIVCEKQCDYVVFAGVYPDNPSIRKAKEAGARTLCFAPSEQVAMRMLKFGIDALILEGSEAGGHIGPISSTILIQEVLFKVRQQVPVFIAGGVATGAMMAHLMLMGAAGVQMGTRFVMSEECNVHPDFKEAFRKAKARDAIATPQFDSKLPVIPVRALNNKGMDRFRALQFDLLRRLENREIRRLDAMYEVESFWVGALRRASQDGDLSNGSLMAGQSVGLANEVKPLRDIFTELLDDAEAELDRIAQLVRND